MHMAHKIRNTLKETWKSSSDWLNSTVFPGDVCVAFFNVPPGNNDAVMPKPLMEEESCKVRGRLFIKIRPKVLLTSLLLWRHFHAPKHGATQNVIGCFTSRFPDHLPLVWRSVYARLEKRVTERISERIGENKIFKYVLLLFVHDFYVTVEEQDDKNYRFDKCLCKGREIFSAPLWSTCVHATYQTKYMLKGCVWLCNKCSL